MVVSTVSKYIVLNILHYERNNTYDKRRTQNPVRHMRWRFLRK